MFHIISDFTFPHLMQIEGAFIQGLGWVALEELKWGDAAHKWVPSGHLYTCGPGSYKIPSINDVPFKFNVSLLKVICCSLLCQKYIIYKIITWIQFLSNNIFFMSFLNLSLFVGGFRGIQM